MALIRLALGDDALRHVTMLLIAFLCAFDMAGQLRSFVVADSVTRMPLSNASIFDRGGRFLGTSDVKGKVSCALASDYPITLRYLGYHERTVPEPLSDTIRMSESIMELPEVVVESRNNKVLHILAYVREYSALSTYTDTVTLFREKMVDFMLPDDNKSRFKGWNYPRILNSKSYYCFTDSNRLDSVSDCCNNYFTWSDWIGVVPAMALPEAIRSAENGTDTLSGKYTPAEIWVKNSDRVSLDINVLADTLSRRWVPNLASFFRNDNIDFEQFRMHLNYGNVTEDLISPADLTGYSFNIESRGRGRGMFQFNRYDEPFFVATYTEVYVLDKEYISVKEARKWERNVIDPENLVIYEPMEAPELQPSVLALIDRVNNVDIDRLRLQTVPDHRLVSRKVSKWGIGHRALGLLKQLTGVTLIKSHKNMDRQWRGFRNKLNEVNSQNVPTDSVVDVNSDPVEQ